jgi:2-polyprenyl-6-methoxyphenol hydroxylase-like FAD-dependent oxidoreductase
MRAVMRSPKVCWQTYWVEPLHREAENLLPFPFREIVEATTQPFAQAIRDLASDHMVVGRVVIIGDAAAIPRPHTAASTSKAAANALALADELLASPGDVPAALVRWEPRKSHWASTFASRELKLAITCSSKDRRLRKLGDAATEAEVCYLLRS